MNILVTLDYEIYFGRNHGTVGKCLLEPTNALMRIAERHGVRFVFFVDCGYLVALREQAGSHSSLARDLATVEDQLKLLAGAGHDLQLHIHPHWEDTRFDGLSWRMDISRYKLADFPDQDIRRIVSKYRETLESVASNPVLAYRAGGWCMQPFTRIGPALRENGIRIDSSVFRGGYSKAGAYDYDFRGAPAASVYRFGDDPVREDPKGFFTEYPITQVYNSPLFFWRLFLMGRLDPRRHKPIGDGQAMPAPGMRTRLLTRFTRNGLSMDGYNVRMLPAAVRRASRRGHENMVVIGHPKALSPYSIESFDRFVERMNGRHRFTTFTELHQGQ